MICDGASEHTKFFRIVLHGAASQSPTLNVYMGHPCDETVKVFAISDVPHLIKKGRGSLYRSGDNPWSTRRMIYGVTGDTVHDGSLMIWRPLTWLHEERNKKNEFGERRRKWSCMYLCVLVVYLLFECMCSFESDQEIGGPQHVSNKFGIVEGTSRSHSVQ